MRSFEDYLSASGRVDERSRPFFLRWVMMYKGRMRRENVDTQAMNDFIEWLSPKYPDWQVEQARDALRLYSYYRVRNGIQSPKRVIPTIGGSTPGGRGDPTKKIAPCRPVFPSWEALEQGLVRVLRLKHLSYKTEKSYLSWFLRFKSFVRKKACGELTEQDVKDFLSFLAVERKVSAATQRIAFNALLFLYRNLLAVEINGLGTVVPSRIHRKLPVVLTKDEVKKVFAKLKGPYRLMGALIYGGGLRLQECVSLRVKDIDSKETVLSFEAARGARTGKQCCPKASSRS